MLQSTLIALALTVVAPAPKETPKDAPKLEGDWAVETFEGPKAGPPGQVTFRFTDGKIKIFDSKREKPEDATITVDLKKNPATIDIKPDNSPKDILVKGIVEVNGDTMKLCFARVGERPTEFKADVANGVVMFTLKRAKPEK